LTLRVFGYKLGVKVRKHSTHTETYEKIRHPQTKIKIS
jgi:hypothetical protein